MTREVFVIDAVRTPIGRYAGGLATVRPDDLAAHVIDALVRRIPALAGRLDQVVFGATNQAGEDNRNVARMAVLLSGLPDSIPGITVNRLCASGMSAIAMAAQAIRAGDADIMVAGGVESMTRAPWVQAKPDRAWAKPGEAFDTSIGWRFVNPKMAERYGCHQMGETAEINGKDYGITREEQDAFALESHRRAVTARDEGRFKDEIAPIEVPQKKGEPIVFAGAASLHRRAAFEAADYLMDRLKTEAVFWKREVGEDGSRWIEPTDTDHADRQRWG